MYKTHKCDYCGKSQFCMKQCARCKLVRYCDRNCQLHKWPEHKLTCQKQQDMKRHFDTRDPEGEECSICLEPILSESNCNFQLKCGHWYHTDCVRKLLEHDEGVYAKCPNCRKPLPSLTNLGNALHAQGDFAGAIEAYNSAIAIDPENAIAHANLGHALATQKDFASAIEAFKKAVVIDPENAIAHANLGRVLSVQGNFAGAIKAYKKAIDIEPNPNLAAMYMNLGNTFCLQGDIAGAIKAYNMAINIDPKFAKAYLNLGNALHKQGDIAGAIEAYNKVVTIDPEFAFVSAFESLKKK